ncbi:DUF3223 domain-containing protein [Paracoccus sp. SCSIO 75233]
MGGTRSFYITYSDGHKENFSTKKCIKNLRKT